MRLLIILLLYSATALALFGPAPRPRAETPIPGRYIVKLRSSKFLSNLHAAKKLLKTEPLFTYKTGKFGGFAADIPDDVVKILRRLPIVDWIEQDKVMTTSLLSSTHGESVEKRAFDTESGSTWGLARISHRTVGSQTYGVAKSASLFAVKVFDSSGSGSSSTTLAGLNFVATDAKTRAGCGNGIVVSMSLDGARSTAVNMAVSDLVSSGIFVVVAAGNDGADASNYSPASEATAFTVGATNSSDGFAYFSNYGGNVDILAPGVAVLSTWPNNQTNILSGTSMATPHVAGLAAYILTLEGKKDPSTLAARLSALSTKMAIWALPSGTKNYLAFNGYSGT
ncbi:subtilisin-like serine protease [Curvularia kusanoi]|uniref:Subtilisin-like serine protease n=1 Tax=Curvularia kusanoi TaxID=90978 RepID=A0A9P4WEN5_CURKU|nr:subtilisin-like serine protease [Curvularia kusanoi]